MNADEWSFADPKNVATFSLRRIFQEGRPILYVSHDEEDGAWQFLDGEDVTEEDAWVVALEEVVNHDASTKELADLPLGWCAWRATKDSPWERGPKLTD